VVAIRTLIGGELPAAIHARRRIPFSGPMPWSALLLTRNEPPPSFIRAADILLTMPLDAGLSRSSAVEGLSIFQSYVIGHSVLD
jgi:hypothetical protein